jgi:hypothetical protein
VRSNAQGAAFGVVAIQAPMAIRTVLMVTNDDVLTIAHNNIGLTQE